MRYLFNVIIHIQGFLDDKHRSAFHLVKDLPNIESEDTHHKEK